jgi:para-aminobenzoate synthetase / 4-amino-4-deoxychorismate lyase
MATLIFDFPEPEAGRSVRTVYRDPVRVVVARSVGEVGDAVAAIEAAVAGGLHAAGFIAYEAAPAFDPRARVRTGNRLPLLWFGLFEGPAAAPATGGDPGPGDPLAGAEWRLELDRTRYDGAVAAVREAIADGWTYQVNLTARLRAALAEAATANPVTLYESLRRAQGAGWHALLDLGDEVIVSVSPELFFRTSGRRIETRPMKGTRPRGRWAEEDEALRTELASAEKDRSENLMIVDLLRNDLGRVCEVGSVTVPRLFDVERYRTVWQLTSSVEGRLRDDVGLGDILAALFPCGSVTGAPKISTMERIAALEASPREVYCGAIGMVRPGGDAVFNVPIRTLWWNRSTGSAEYGTGGGIVWDSTAESEYDELLSKAVVVREAWPAFDLIETMAARSGTIARLDRHLDRLARSADYFGFACPRETLRAALADTAATRPDVPRRVRLTLAMDGAFAISEGPLGLVGADRPEPGTAPLRVALADGPVRSADRFLFHKTTHRATYDQARAGDRDAFDTLLWNERGEATEFTRGNLVVELEGRRVTPPLAAGLLPGCFRAELLEQGTVVEATVTTADVRRADRLWFVNSARRWLEVVLPATP